MLDLILALALAAPATPTAATTAAMPGIWEGTVGSLPVRACFTRRDHGTFGAYYYMSRMRMIALEAEEGAGGGFREGAGGGAGPGENPPRWRIEQAGATQLTARWTNGGRTLPVRLRRVARQTGEDSPCGSIVFHRPRLAGVHTVSTRATVDGTAYTKLTLDTGGHFEIGVQTFALDGDSAAVRRLNATLAGALAGTPPNWFGCISGSLEMMPYEGESHEGLEPAMISRRWLSVASHGDQSCGGAHPDASNSYLLFDLTSGAEIDLLDWFNATAVKRETFEGSAETAKTLEPAFREFILAGWHPPADSAECDEVVRGQDYWNIGLTRDGFVFSPSLPHVVQACFEEFTVTFDRARPWLTPDAAAHIRALRAERSGA